MSKIVDTRCLTNKVSTIHTHDFDIDLTKETLRELVKAVAMVVKEYKVTVSLKSIETKGASILEDLLNAVESNIVKERVNKDGIVDIDWNARVIRFIERPTCLDKIVASNRNNLGDMVVKVLQYIKNNYDTNEVKALYDYYLTFSDKKFCVTLSDLTEMLNTLTGLNIFRKVSYAMHYKKCFEITIKSTYSRYYRSRYITEEYIYLGSVK